MAHRDTSKGKTASSSEKVIEAYLVQQCKQRGALCIKLLADLFNGLPDRMCLFKNANVVFVELKSTGMKPRKLQIHVHNAIKNLGFEVIVIDTKEGVDELIRKHYE